MVGIFRKGMHWEICLASDSDSEAILSVVVNLSCRCQCDCGKKCLEGERNGAWGVLKISRENGKGV